MEQRIDRRNLQVDFHTTVQKAFPYGFKPDVLMERIKLVNAWSALGFGKFPYDAQNEIPFLELAKRVGMFVNGRYYIFTNEARAAIRAVLDEVEQTGANLIFYDKLYEAYQHALTEAGVPNVEFFDVSLHKYFPDLNCSREYFRFKVEITPEREMIGIFGQRVAMTVEEIEAALPWQSQSFIRETLSHAQHLMNCGEGLYILAEALVFDEAEVAAAFRTVSMMLEEQGFAGLYAWELPHTMAINPGVPLWGLIKVLAKRRYPIYRLTDTGVLCRPGYYIKHATLIRDYCKNTRAFSLADIEAYMLQHVKTIAVNQIVKIAQESALQIDEKHFVALDTYEFDIEVIDRELERRLEGFPSSVKDIRDLKSLPAPSGAKWTHHMLASYCLRKSWDFALVRPTANNSAHGIIVPRHLAGLDYYTLAATILLYHNVRPEFEEVQKFTMTHGMLYSKKRSPILQVISKMYELTEEFDPRPPDNDELDMPTP